MSERLKIGILGAGRWGTHLIRNFLNNDRATVVAIVDPNPERLEAVRDRHQLGASVILTDDWESILSKVQGVVVVTPATTHYPIIRRALLHHCHVLAEKPLTLDGEEGLELCHLADRHQCQLVVDHTYLFHPAVQRGREILTAGKVGDRRYGYAARTHLGPVRQDVDAMWDLAIHDLAIFNYWLGETPMEVKATGSTWLQPGLGDVVWVQLIYPSGFEATLHLCWFNPDKQRRLAVVGSCGTLIFDELSADLLVLQQGQLAREGQRFTPVGLHREAIAVSPGEPLQQVCNHFLDCVFRGETSPHSSGWVGAELVRILQAIAAQLRLLIKDKN